MRNAVIKLKEEHDEILRTLKELNRMKDIKCRSVVFTTDSPVTARLTGKVADMLIDDAITRLNEELSAKATQLEKVENMLQALNVTRERIIEQMNSLRDLYKYLMYGDDGSGKCTNV